MIKKLFYSLLLFPFLALSQQTVEGTFDVADGYTFGIMYKINPDNVFYVTDSSIYADGKFTLNVPETVTPGMYRLVYNLPQDQYFFDFIYNGKEDITFNFSNASGPVFTSSKENMLWSTFKSKSKEFDDAINALVANEDTPPAKVTKLLKTQTKWYNDILDESQGTLVQNFIKAAQPVLTTTYSAPQMYKAQSKRAYLKHLDFSDTLLQNSAFPLERSLTYIFKYKDDTDLDVSLQKNIDDVAGAMKNASPDYQKSLQYDIYNFLVANELVTAANYMATNHLIPLATELGDTKILQQATTFKNLSIGSKAPNFTWVNEEGDTPQSFYDIDPAQKYVIVFWSSLCSHCLVEVPKLHKFVKQQEEGALKVIAVGLEEEPYRWKNTTYDLPLFTHVLGLGKWDNEIGNAYDVSATPTYFVLDSDLKITAKPYTYEELISLLEVVK